MKHTCSILAVIIISLLSNSLYAQNVFRLHLIGGVSFNTTTAGVFNNWGDGWSLGSGLGYPITPSISLGINLSYSRYPFQGDNLQLVFPAIAGLRWSVSGKPSNMFEASVSARTTSDASFINPFLSLTAGIYRLDIGKIVVSSWFGSNPQNVERVTYGGSGVSTTKIFAAVGVGFSIPVRSNMRVTVEGRFAQTFNPEESFVPLLSSIQLDL